MTIVTFNPSHQEIEYFCFDTNPSNNNGDLLLRLQGTTPTQKGCLKKVQNKWKKSGIQKKPDAIGIRVVFGGNLLTAPTCASPEVVDKLYTLIPMAPMHVPVLTNILKETLRTFPSTPIILVPETAFFASLPPGEQIYGLNRKAYRGMAWQKYGFQGIYHEAVALDAERQYPERKNLKIISFCLEAKPEIAAIVGNRPIMVTGGNTPLDGIPGHTTCGNIDPAIVLKLNDSLESGMDGTARLLSRESGLSGLVGRPTTLTEVLSSRLPEYDLPRRMLHYHILCACGSAIAVMGSVDVIAFSGRYAKLSENIAPQLVRQLTFRNTNNTQHINRHIMKTSREELIAETAISCFSANQKDVIP
ncbi:MAG: acetate/propionate family kinase [Kiritimatiellae bacterium]|nr:acetate/propionate family kinase [Kiritimatiellia bacterium]